MIGNSPKSAPSSAEFSAWPTGMPYTAMATTSATASAESPAHWAFRRSPPSSTNSVSSGSAAKIEDSASDSPIGS